MSFLHLFQPHPTTEIIVVAMVTKQAIALDLLILKLK